MGCLFLPASRCGTLSPMLENVSEFALDHWPFVVVAAALAVVGKVMDERVFTYERARKGWMRWFRKTMPLHPLLTGLLIGLVPGIPVSEFVDSLAGRCLYFVGAGFCSLGFLSFMTRSLAFELPLPGDSEPPK